MSPQPKFEQDDDGSFVQDDDGSFVQDDAPAASAPTAPRRAPVQVRVPARTFSARTPNRALTTRS